MKDSSTLLGLLLTLLKELAAQCSTAASRDVRRTIERTKHEGISFLLITLPDFARDFNLALERGLVTSDLFIGWKKRLSLPAFMQGFLSQCFDAKTGRILDEPHIHAIRAVRQIGLFCKKVQYACTPARADKAFAKYETTDFDLPGFNSVDFRSFEEFRAVARVVVGTVLSDKGSLDWLVPHHGPGSTAEKLQGNRKYGFSATIPRRFAPWFDESLFFNSEESFFLSGIDIQPLREDQELPVRVVSVPKTLKTPRIIAMEPVAMQMAQQALKDVLVDRIETSALTRGHVNFTDQNVNRTLALQSSSSKRLATMDLEEASDRVHNDFVKVLFEVVPDWSELVQMTRSWRAELPDGRVIELNKFASMGSALCFPVEALFFYVLLILSGLKHRALPITFNNIKLVARDIYVYGDDIICPVEQVDATIDIFATFGCKVGLHKTFYKGAFRESCGMDAYDGVDITPVYMRKPVPSRWRDSSAIVSCISTANQLYNAGYEKTAFYLREKIEAVTGKLPVVESTCSGLGWFFGEADKRLYRLSKPYQRPEARTIVVGSVKEEDPLDGYGALAKCLTNLELSKGTRTVSDDHLSYTSLRGAVTLKRRWVPTY